MLSNNNNKSIFESKYKIDKLNLSFQEFIDCNKINIDKLVVDKFWHSIEDDNIWIYVDENIAEWTGLLAKDGSLKIIYKSVNQYLIENMDFIIYDNFGDFKNNFIDKFHGAFGHLEKESFKRGNKSKYLIVKPSLLKKNLLLKNKE